MYTGALGTSPIGLIARSRQARAATTSEVFSGDRVEELRLDLAAHPRGQHELAQESRTPTTAALGAVFIHMPRDVGATVLRNASTEERRRPRPSEPLGDQARHVRHHGLHLIVGQALDQVDQLIPIRGHADGQTTRPTIDGRQVAGTPCSSARSISAWSSQCDTTTGASAMLTPPRSGRSERAPVQRDQNACWAPRCERAVRTRMTSASTRRARRISRRLRSSRRSAAPTDGGSVDCSVSSTKDLSREPSHVEAERSRGVSVVVGHRWSRPENAV